VKAEDNGYRQGKRVKRIIERSDIGNSRTLTIGHSVHGVLWASAPVAILVVGEEGSLHPAVAAGALFFSAPVVLEK
jgi:hypothetical protein